MISLSFIQDKNPGINENLATQNNYLFCPGNHTINSPVSGSRAEELRTVLSKAEIFPIIFHLEKAIYLDKFTYLIPLDKKDEADASARYMFKQYIQKYASAGCSEENIVEWMYEGNPGLVSNKTMINDVENEFNTWSVKIRVEGRHGNFNEKYDKYLPPHIVAYHEVMHAEEIPKNSPETFEMTRGIELLTSIKTLILLDRIYKTVHGINEDVEINYDENIEIEGHFVSLGLFANLYRELEQKYEKLYLALISPESLAFLSNHFPKLPADLDKIKSQMHEIQNQINLMKNHPVGIFSTGEVSLNHTSQCHSIESQRIQQMKSDLHKERLSREKCQNKSEHFREVNRKHLAETNKETLNQLTMSHYMHSRNPLGS